MDVVIVLVFAALLVAGGFLAALIWAIRSGQYDDTCTPAIRILHDNHKGDPNKEENGLSSMEN